MHCSGRSLLSSFAVIYVSIVTMSPLIGFFLVKIMVYGNAAIKNIFKKDLEITDLWFLEQHAYLKVQKPLKFMCYWG